MTLADIGEFGFIDRIRQGCLIRPQSVIRAIGDDAAAYEPAAGELVLVTTDLLVERVHFLKAATSGFNLGHKALAVNLSDIAAMGGTARQAFVGIAVPESCSLAYLEDFYRGMQSLAGEYGVNILGGDTTASKNDLAISITVTGSVPAAQMLCRDGARPGDRICVSGFLGDSRAGLHLVLNHITPDTPAFRNLFQAHVLPRPCLAEGRFLACSGAVSAAIDVSDGLSADLWQIARSSRVGACLHADRIPLSKDLHRFCSHFGYDALEYALAGGEDYTLLFTVEPTHFQAVAQGFSEQFGNPLHVIGQITDSGKLEIESAGGRRTPLTPSGWNHFKPG